MLSPDAFSNEMEDNVSPAGLGFSFAFWAAAAAAAAADAAAASAACFAASAAFAVVVGHYVHILSCVKPTKLKQTRAIASGIKFDLANLQIRLINFALPIHTSLQSRHPGRGSLLLLQPLLLLELLPLRRLDPLVDVRLQVKVVHLPLAALHLRPVTQTPLGRLPVDYLRRQLIILCER